MLNRTLATLITALATLSLIIGCSDQSNGTPTPIEGSGQSPQPGNSLPSHGAPKVENPIDTAKFEADPCSVTTNAQLKKAGFDMKAPETQPDNATGPQCKWTFSQSGYGVVAGAFVSISDRGLSDLYDQRDTTYRELFEEIPSVAGYPAVIYDTQDARKSGLCAVAVGVRDDQTYEVATLFISDNPDFSNPCKVAQKIAEIAVGTMKKAAS